MQFFLMEKKCIQNQSWIGSLGNRADVGFEDAVADTKHQEAL